MGVEIERKFLVQTEQWKGEGQGTLYRQGYLCAENERTVRVRIAGDTGYMTVKGKSIGASRVEYEYIIPVQDAAVLLERLCLQPIIEKKRYRVPYRGVVWEVDEFMGENDGLVVAEIELTSENQSFVLPDWVGREVTDDVRYYNSHLISSPYCSWKENM